MAALPDLALLEVPVVALAAFSGGSGSGFSLQLPPRGRPKPQSPLKGWAPGRYRQ